MTVTNCWEKYDRGVLVWKCAYCLDVICCSYWMKKKAEFSYKYFASKGGKNLTPSLSLSSYLSYSFLGPWCQFVHHFSFPFQRECCYFWLCKLSWRCGALSSEVLRKLSVSAAINVFRSYNTVKIYLKGLFCAAAFESTIRRREVRQWDWARISCRAQGMAQEGKHSSSAPSSSLCWPPLQVGQSRELPWFLTVLPGWGVNTP